MSPLEGQSFDELLKAQGILTLYCRNAAGTD